jgi:hypothetical protein
MGMDQYLLIPFLGDEHPFTSYFDVHQGYKVLTHCHIELLVSGGFRKFPDESIADPGHWRHWRHH